MRKIKFRGKRIDNGEWVYGDLIQLDSQSCIAGTHQWATALQNNSLELAVDEVITETIGQLTGLKDKNGVEIYEGDKISFIWFSYNGECEVDNLYKGEVKFIDGSFMFCCEHGNYAFSQLDFDSECDIEVLGSIHDKPELIANLE